MEKVVLFLPFEARDKIIAAEIGKKLSVNFPAENHKKCSAEIIITSKSGPRIEGNGNFPDFGGRRNFRGSIGLQQGFLHLS